MNFNIDVQKKHFFAILGAILVLASAFTVYAYSSNNPSYFGHSAGELDKVSSAVYADSAGYATTAGNADPDNYIHWDNGQLYIDNTPIVGLPGTSGNVGSAGSVSYATNAGGLTVSPGSGSWCHICIRTGKDGCANSNPKDVSGWSCVPLNGATQDGPWTAMDNGNCVQLRVFC